MRCEWGFPISFLASIADSPSVGSKLMRFHISLDFEDNIPEEIERIDKMIKEENIKRWCWNLLNSELERPDTPLKEKLCRDLYTARKYYEEGNLEEAKEYYTRIFNLGNSLYKQTESYILSCLKQEEALKSDSRAASEHYRKGDIEKAKELWQKVIDDAEVRPLELKL